MPFATEVREELAGDRDLLEGVAPRLDGDPGGVAHERHELLVDVGVLLHVGDVDRVRLLELGEAGLERLRDDLVVDTGGERALRAAPDGHVCAPDAS